MASKTILPFVTMKMIITTAIALSWAISCWRMLILSRSETMVPCIDWRHSRSTLSSPSSSPLFSSCAVLSTPALRSASSAELRRRPISNCLPMSPLTYWNIHFFLVLFKHFVLFSIEVKLKLTYSNYFILENSKTALNIKDW